MQAQIQIFPALVVSCLGSGKIRNSGVWCKVGRLIVTVPHPTHTLFPMPIVG